MRYPRRSRDSAPSFLCAPHVMCLGGESPLRAVMSGTVRLSKGVGREAESEGSEGGSGGKPNSGDTTDPAAASGRSSRGGGGGYWPSFTFRHISVNQAPHFGEGETE